MTTTRRLAASSPPTYEGPLSVRGASITPMQSWNGRSPPDPAVRPALALNAEFAPKNEPVAREGVRDGPCVLGWSKR